MTTKNTTDVKKPEQKYNVWVHTHNGWVAIGQVMPLKEAWRAVGDWATTNEVVSLGVSLQLA